MGALLIWVLSNGSWEHSQKVPHLVALSVFCGHATASYLSEKVSFDFFACIHLPFLVFYLITAFLEVTEGSQDDLIKVNVSDPPLASLVGFIASRGLFFFLVLNGPQDGPPVLQEGLVLQFWELDVLVSLANLVFVVVRKLVHDLLLQSIDLVMIATPDLKLV